MASSAPAATPAPFLPEGMLYDLLAVSLTGVNVLRPVYEATGELVDFAIDYLNPAAQRMTGLSERPGGTARTRFPAIFTNGVFPFYRRVFETGEAGHYAFNYQADGFDNYFRVAARRSGEWLVVSFTDTADQDRTPVEVALRESQAAEQTARAETEAQRRRFYEVLMALPAQVATYHGPNHVFQFVNAAYRRYFPTQALPGRSLREVLPESEEQGVLAVMDRVYQTGEPQYLPELEVWLDFSGTGQDRRQLFLNLYFHPLHNAQGEVEGLVDFSYDVTEQVRARQQVEQLNQELETRVQARTRELTAQQGLLNQILAQVPAAITTLHGPEHRFTFANDRYQHLTQGRVQVGRTVAETLPEVAEQGFIELLDNVYRSGQTFEGKEIAILLAPPDGPPRQHFLDFTYQPMPDEHGQTQGLLVFAVDVTEQVRTRRQAGALQTQLLAAAQHQAAERLAFYQIFEQTPALVALLRAPGHRFEYANPAYQALFPGQLVGRDAVDAAPELAAQGFIALLDRVYQTGETYFGQDLPFTPVPAPGQAPHTNYFDFTYQAYRENGAIAGISIIAFNVTEQVLARQEREAQRRQLEETFAQAPVAICVFRGPAYVLELVNPPMGAMLGQPPATLLGQLFFEALPELTDQGLREVLDGVRRTGRPFVAQERELALAHRPQEVGFYNFTYEPLRDEHGQVVAITCVAIEVTAQVRARQRVQELNEELAAINEEMQATNEELLDANTRLTRTNADLDTFVYTASHDLKAPIANIEGLLDVLLEYLPTADQEPLVPQVVERMQGAIARFQETVGHLTDVSRLHYQTVQPTVEVDLARLVEGVRLDLLLLLESTQGDLRLDVAACPTLHFSAKNLRSIVYNLLSNGLKYRAPDRPPVVQLQARRSGQQVVLEVQDNGLGLSEQQQGKLFTMFKRLHTHVEGSGVGLYMIKRLIENAGGTITVRSQPGVGSTFTVTLPHA